MPNELFFDIVDQATEMGYDTFGLTPITGDIFMDKRIFEKLDFLEQHPKVVSYSFYTNFTVLDPDKARRLTDLEKLKELSISIYGHDEDSFVKIAESTPKVFRRLVDNLQALHEVLDSAKPDVQIGWRTYDSFRMNGKESNDLTDVLAHLKASHDVPVNITREYDNWGGIITQKDVQGLDILMAEETLVPKNGACSLIFYKMQVMADGRVNACACRDANATLQIGDLRGQRLDEIISGDNQIYMSLIDAQQEGRFNPICFSCTQYRSIYKYNKLYQKHTKSPVTLEAFFDGVDRGSKAVST
jgi:uncharacterized Fe-S cluster-containing radical SAM superfamily protein